MRRQATTGRPPRACARPKPTVRLLVIGYGNTLRSDDGVGPWVAGAVAGLKLPGVHAIACAQLTPELAEPVAAARVVVFVDAAVARRQRLRLHKLTPSRHRQIAGHTNHPEALLALAQTVFGSAPPAWLLTIPVQTLAFGQGLSAAVRVLAARAVARIRRLAAVGQ